MRESVSSRPCRGTQIFSTIFLVHFFILFFSEVFPISFFLRNFQFFLVLIMLMPYSVSNIITSNKVSNENVSFKLCLSEKRHYPCELIVKDCSIVSLYVKTD